MGEKPAEKGEQRQVLPVWNWVAPTYTVKLKKNPSPVEFVEIDPKGFLPDVNRKNNKSLSEQITIDNSKRE
jgi:hypothetical protein